MTRYFQPPRRVQFHNTTVPERRPNFLRFYQNYINLPFNRHRFYIAHNVIASNIFRRMRMIVLIAHDTTTKQKTLKSIMFHARCSERQVACRSKRGKTGHLYTQKYGGGEGVLPRIPDFETRGKQVINHPVRYIPGKVPTVPYPTVPYRTLPYRTVPMKQDGCCRPQRQS